jgi:hypothetical protein
MARNVIGHFHRRLGSAVIEPERVDNFYVGRPGEREELIHIRLVGNGQGRAVGGVAADAKVFDAEGFEGGDERAVIGAEKVVAVRIWQHALHLEAEADEIGWNLSTRMAWIQYHGNGRLRRAPNGNQTKDCQQGGFEKRGGLHGIKVTRAGPAKSEMQISPSLKLPKNLQKLAGRPLSIFTIFENPTSNLLALADEYQTDCGLNSCTNPVSNQGNDNKPLGRIQMRDSFENARNTTRNGVEAHGKP